MEMPLDGERFEAFLEQHRDWLRRWFMSRCGDLATSEDLVQETALEAWRNRHKFTVSGNQRGWLAAIGNHVFRRWQRSIGRSRISTSPHGSGSEVHIERTQGAFSAHSDESTLLVERQELASFIDRAGGELPASTWHLLRDRYYAELSIAEMAEQAGITAPHMAVRLQRARKQLRTIMLSSYPADAALYGYGAAQADPHLLRTTRLWCPRCGQQRLLMRLDASQGRFSLECPSCNDGEQDFLYNWQIADGHARHPLTGIRNAPQALTRTLESATWKIPRAQTHRTCPECDGTVQCRTRSIHPDQESIATTQIDLWCAQCGFLGQSATFAGMAIFHPEGMCLWQEHGRIRTEQVAETTVSNAPAVTVTLASVSSSASRTFAFSADASRLLLVD